MSIYVSGIRQDFDDLEEVAISKAFKKCGILPKDAKSSYIYRMSIDARHGKISKVYTVVIDGVENDEKLVKKIDDFNIRYKEQTKFLLVTGKQKLCERPVVIGFGPCGIFAAYILAKYGYKPIVIERGQNIKERDKAVDKFSQKGCELNENSNIQFGEGGAGTYSDGKLTTRINDSLCDEVLKILVKFGAPSEICKKAKPHIGTDILKNVVKKIRNEIIRLGGDIYFETKLTSINNKNGNLYSINTTKGEIFCTQAILAIGHSARDTFKNIYENGVFLQPKPFSVGVRIEHLQKNINYSLYGKNNKKINLPPAEYNVSHRYNSRACYSFCMCPGGSVVAAQSEQNTIVTNGMSYHARDGLNANSAIAVSVAVSDFENNTPLGGVEFQRYIERSAFNLTGSYKAPCQRFGDFLNDVKSKSCGSVKPTYPIGVEYAEIGKCLPNFVVEQIKIGICSFGKKIKGFDDKDALLTAPETRTSSPVRILRKSDFYSVNINGLIPAGEGAGYAGGIMSSAVDGIKAATCIIEKYSPDFIT